MVKFPLAEQAANCPSSSSWHLHKGAELLPAGEHALGWDSTRNRTEVASVLYIDAVRSHNTKDRVLPWIEGTDTPRKCHHRIVLCKEPSMPVHLQSFASYLTPELTHSAMSSYQTLFWTKGPTCLSAGTRVQTLPPKQPLMMMIYLTM